MAISLINTECKRYGCMKNLLACYANCRYNTRCDELRNEVEAKLDQATTDINSYLSERGRSPIVIQFPKRGLKFAEPAKPRTAVAKEKKLATPARAHLAVAPAAAPGAKPAAKSAPAKEPEPSKPKLKAKPVRKKQSKSKRGKGPVTGEAMREIKPEVKPAARRKAAAPVKAVALRSVPKTEPRKLRVMARRAKPAASLNAIEPTAPRASESSDQEPNVNKANRSKESAPRKKRSRNTSAPPSRAKGKTYIVLEGNSATIVDEQGLMLRLMNGASPATRFFEATEVEAKIQISYKR